MVRTRSTTAVDRGGGTPVTPKAIIEVDTDSDFEDDVDEFLTTDQEDSDIQEIPQKKVKDDKVKSGRGRGRPKKSDKDKNKTQTRKSSSSSKIKKMFTTKTTATPTTSTSASTNGNGSQKKSASASVKKGVKRKSKKDEITKAGTRSINSYFRGKSPSPSSSSSAPSSPEKEQEPKKRKLDPGVLEFLFSGVPEAVAKAQKEVEKKKEEDEHLSRLAFFPKIHEAVQVQDKPGSGDPDDDEMDAASLPLDIKSNLPKGITYREAKAEDEDDDDCQNIHAQISQRLTENINIPEDEVEAQEVSEIAVSCGLNRLCCDFDIDTKVETDTSKSPDKADTHTTTTRADCLPYPIPWITIFKADRLKDLVCDKVGLQKFTSWLKQWKSDIKDDGGMSRKQEKKKRRGKDSDSDFFTSDEEVEFKKKSVVLSGPPGCGKTTAVYVTARHYGFHVVEVNFSSRRGGKEVLQRVEEAVLSQRVKNSSGDQNQNCLLLFEDINLLDPKEDEGFHAAVAQLITTAVRPIVMTMTTPTSTTGLYDYNYMSMPALVEKKDPLLIHFQSANSFQIIRKVMIPIFRQLSQNSNSNSCDNDDEDENENEKPKIPTKLLRISDSICRHSRGDIRQTINQLQFLLAKTKNQNDLEDVSISKLSHQLELQLNVNGNGGNGSALDFHFIRPSSETSGGSDGEDQDRVQEIAYEDEDEDEEQMLNLSKNARRKEKSLKSLKNIEKLEKIGEMLGNFSEIDFLTGVKVLERNSQFNEDEEEQELQSRKQMVVRNCFDPVLWHSVRETLNPGTLRPLKLAKSLILEDDKEINVSRRCGKLFEELGEYCDNIYADGGWETASYVRSIIKRSKMDSIGLKAKRNGRLTSYFNRLDRNFVDRICQSFGYNVEIEMAQKLISDC